MNIYDVDSKNIDSEYEKAKAIVRFLYYISDDMHDLGFNECNQLTRFIADAIRLKYKIQDGEALLN